MGRLRIIGLLVIFIILGSCGGEPPQPTKVPMPPLEKKEAAPSPPASAPAQKPAMAPPTEVQTAAASSIPYTYDPRGKTDPFKPLVVDKLETPPPPQAKKAEESIPENAPPLEKLDLAQLKLVAIVWGIAEPRGMVEDTMTRGYIISKGTTIGRNKGIVTRINSAGVFINEKYEASDGKFKTREVTLKLHAD